VERNAPPFRVLAALLLVVAGILVTATPGFALGLPPLPPTPTAPPPSIAGSAVQGATLSCSPGGWLNATSYTYTWLAGVSQVAGPSTSNTYTLTSSDVGQLVTCSVTAYNGTTPSVTPALSTPIGPVGAPLPGLPIEESPPVISGTAMQGQTVTCSQGGWLSATSYSYSWQRDASNISGATSPSYALTSADVNKAITCTVVASNSSGNSAPATSLPIVPVALPPVGTVPVETAPPAISGGAVEGQTVTCSSGSWLNNPTSYSYSWQRDALNITGATGSSYRLTSADVSQAVTCAVVAGNSFGPSVPAISLPILPVALSGVGGGSGGGGGSGAGSSAGPGGAKLGAPTVKAFSVVPRIVTMLVHGKRQTTKGATFRYTLDKTAGVLIALQRPLAGRVHGKSCVAVTRTNQRARKCTRWVTFALLGVRSARAGANQLKFAGRVKGRLLGVGSYRAIVVAVNAAGWSKTRSAGFKVARKRVSSKR
jgi:hypothetical protein